MKNEKSSKKINLIEGDIRSTLTRLTLPMMTGFIAMIIFNTADMVYLGMLGGDELTAISFTFPIAMMFIAIAQGLGVGVSSVVARKIGAGDLEEGKRVTTHTIILALLISITVSIFGMLTLNQVFTALGADSEIRPMIKEYMEVWYIGMVFVMVPMVGNNVIRATGDAKTPMYIMLGAAIMNIILDPLLIFGIGPFPRMELQGAAIATVISRGMTMLFTLYLLYYRDHLLELKRPTFKSLKKSWKAVLHVGAPAAVTTLLAPVALSVLTYLASLHGKEAVAAIGVGSRIEFLAILPIFGLSASLIPFVGQNTGAGKFDRIRDAVYMCMKFSFIWGFGATVVMAIFSRQIGLAFSREDAILDKIQLYFMIIPIGYAFQGAVHIAAGYFNASARPLPGAILNSMRYLIFLVPLLFIGNYLMGYTGILTGFVAAGVLAGTISIFWVRRYVSTDDPPPSNLFGNGS